MSISSMAINPYDEELYDYWQSMENPEYIKWSDKLSEEAIKEQDIESARLLKETDDLNLPPF